MNVNRLTILRNFMATEVPEDRYNQSLFWCDSRGCASGWATQCPDLQADGLSLIHDAPTYKGSNGSDAVRSFFDLTFVEYAHAFRFDSNIDPTNKHETIRHIDEVLTGQIKERENA